ncbi:hypothetical protein BGZ76_010276 [Entomortierella beljakovae]|nr:hypothetical protein BGZ76_010276 [Entomortierella beljakovae]
MAPSKTSSDMERATKRKTTVNMSPSWADEDSLPWDRIAREREEGEEESKLTIHSTTNSTTESYATMLPLTPSQPRTPSTITSNSSTTPRWSDFISMNNISVEMASESNAIEMNAMSLEPLLGTFSQTSLRRHHSPRISKVFNSDMNDGDTNQLQLPTPDSGHFHSCICNRPTLGSLSRHRFSISGLSVGSKRHYQKLSLELGRGYPSGQCVSSLDPPPNTTWDERSSDNSLVQGALSSIKTNTAFNFGSFKMFLNSLMFSNIVKCLIVVVSGLIFATALDTITSNQPGHQKEWMHHTPNR